MPTPNIIPQLVERFDQQRQVYRSGRYNETQLRREFLDPFFEALGWDVINRQGYAEMYKEVIHEDSLDIEGENKAPDYAFRIGGTRKFFVEAKKPAVNIEFNIHPAFQLRRYAWSAKLPLGILTDFEEFAVYDCRVKPDKNDKASTARILLLSYKDYINKWDEIASVFSREAILKGSFDAYAEGLKGKKGTTEVDDAFLAEIERWRELLAKNIALRNPKLTARELNYAVQMTIDRIVFLRICEDRGIERDEQLKDISKAKHIYENLIQLFQRADARYNSGLFHFKNEKEQSSSPDSLTLNLQIDDRTLHDILGNLYYPESPYVFREIPSDILGQVYERFLGKIIRLTDSHQAKIEEKPEVRKAGGVYYTPTYIVDYIVKNTVGKLLEAKTPKDAAKLKILDPACGSGTFPLGAYQYLLDWHLKWYTENELEKSLIGKKPVIFQTKDGYRLTTAKKKEILINNIFGVDIDAQAVEVTKLSLLLKVLEGESQETIGSQLTFLQERVLPDLDKNIQCGNSLIGPEYYEGEQLTMNFANEEERYRVNAFDWSGAFPHVFIQGGFDVVIGNPPYIRIHNLVDFYPNEVKFIQSRYSTANFGKVDIYVAFVEKGLQLLNSRGKLGYILPNKFMQSDYGVGLRKLLVETKSLSQLVDFGNSQVFEGATTYTCLLFLEKSEVNVVRAKFNKSYQSASLFLEDAVFEERNVNSFGRSAWQVASDIDTRILEKIHLGSIPLSDVLESAITGVKTGSNSTFVFEVLERGAEIARLRPEDTDDEVEIETKYLVPYLKAESLKRYHIGKGSRVLLYPYQIFNGQTSLVPEIEVKKYPKTWQYLFWHKHKLEGRQKGKLKGASWYGLSFASSLQMFTSPKIVTPTLSPMNSFSLDTDGNFFPQGAGGGCGLIPKSDFSYLYILGLLNSRLLTFFFQRISSPFQSGWYAYEPRYLNRIPIHPLAHSNNEDKARQEKIMMLVERILELHKRDPRTPQAHEILKREIQSVDREIDSLTYELYGLTNEEIRIVEGK